jgi:uncharacterized cupredoxin-like copper-binding protein
MQAKPRIFVSTHNTPIHGWLTKIAVFLWISMVAIASAQAQTIVPGKMPGQFGVSPSGAASYSIPIQVPPGIAGMQPRLSLEYDSQGGNGIMGVGWNLAGLSSVTRCAQTMAQDGKRGGVNIDTNDRFCMDGQRLVLVDASGNAVPEQIGYGNANTQYRTEMESFSRISFDGNGFKVQNKAGLTMTYLPMQSIAGKGVLVWAVTKISDIVGNYLTMTYTPGVSYIQTANYPAAITRTCGSVVTTSTTCSPAWVQPTISYSCPAGGTLSGNTCFFPSAPESTSFSVKQIDYAGNSVAFEYEARPDVISGFHIGAQTKITQRLQKITSKVGTAPLQSTLISYSPASSGFGSLPSSVITCAATGECLAPLAILWSNYGTQNFDAVNSGLWPGHPNGPQNNITGDFNGDGKTDIATYTGSGGLWTVCLSKGNGFDCGSSPWTGHAGGNTNNITGDFNGDGKTDIAGYSADQRSWHVCLSVGNDFDCADASPSHWWGGHLGGTTNNITGDFNGDGKTDIASYSHLAGMWAVCLSTGSSFVCGPFWTGHGGGVANNVTGDFNGDGMTDIAGHITGTNHWHVCLSTGSDFDCVTRSPSSIWVGHGGGAANNIAGDFNGDGKTDIAGHIPNTNDWHVCLSTGKSFDCGIQKWFGPGGGVINTASGDFNGDGKTDVAGFMGTGTNKWHVCLSTGSSFECGADLWYGEGAGAAYSVVGDFNGDGKTDIAGAMPAGSSQWHVTMSGAKLPHVTGFSTSGGSLVTFTLAPLTAGKDVYTKDSGASYPRVDLQPPMYVVSQVASSNGVGGVNTSQYKYGGLKLEHGRGMLGFRWMENLDLSTNVRGYTQYSQDSRYSGTPLVTTSSHPDARGPSNLLKRSSTVPACKTPQTGVACAQMPDNCNESANAPLCAQGSADRSFVFSQSSLEESWDLNGVQFPSIATMYDYQPSAGDAPRIWGDPTKITVTNLFDGSSKVTDNIYKAADITTTNWILGRLISAKVTSTSPAANIGEGVLPGGGLLGTTALPTFKFNRSPTPMVAGQTTTFVWSTTNATSVNFNCTSTGTGYASNGNTPVSGVDYSPASAAWVGYPSTCIWTATGPGGSTTVNEVLNTVSPLPTITFTRTPSPMVAGQTTTFTWKTTNATSVNFNCTSTVTGYAGSGNPPLNGVDTTPASAAWVGYPSNCIWKVTGPGGTRTVTEVLTTVPPRPTLTLKRTPATMVAGQTTTVTWTTTNATSLNFKCTSTGTGYAGSGNPPVNGVDYTPASAAWVGYPSTCLWTATGLGGTRTLTEVLTTIAPAPLPTFTFTRSPSPMVAGQTTTFTWSTTNATSLSFSCTSTGTGYAGSGNPPVNGVDYTPASAAWVGYPSTCIWKATGPGGTRTVTEVITTVAPPPPPTFSLTRTPSPMVAGQVTTVVWNSTNATNLSFSCTSSGTGYAGSGNPPVSGVDYTPADAAWVGYPSNCTWTATGPGGSYTTYETLNTVAPPPPPPTISLYRNPSPMVAGQPMNVGWSTTNATSLTHNCTSSGTGYVGGGALPLSYSGSSLASASWVGYPSSCSYTVTGPGGSSTIYETLNTVN